MSQHDEIETFRQHLDAAALSNVLLMKYSQEASRGTLVIYSEIQIQEAFAKLANRLGYRIERIAHPTLEAAE
ncbi:hypothetical protein [Rhizobium rhizogenes]|jgi:hypothetical protein|uniref:hypothetical protein n=1 Tax=Rhizobium rhizogenes TaxID=359 RepID=UPI0004D99BB6|nr:hypothetical protein [Rhizobium rhizogenes]KEA07160.1 hypothetical protein CN09_09470 [Rhizobium rhizogenes]NTI80401.1 hypothetical protein [Rhizobium rhizogenes]NTJ22587.1 hypothetical protein [Rhizobium rhizogenes]QUE81293.1 hypothetical protein EML492_05655 [Rhizobium rhizogenes]TQO80608.1 hypothetical protein FFE80_05765 [Rhizobium rhizogenes]